LSRSHRSQQTGSSAQVAPWLRRGRWNCIPIKALEVKSNNNNRAAPRGGPQNKGGGTANYSHPRCLFHTCAAPLRARFVRSPSLSCSTCVGAIDAHTAPPSHTESIESAQVLSSMVPREHSCTFGGNTCDSLCLPQNCGFVRVPIFTVARRRRPDADLPPSSPPPRASLHVTA
jgi:hypothetical protein